MSCSISTPKWKTAIAQSRDHVMWTIRKRRDATRRRVFLILTVNISGFPIRAPFRCRFILVFHQMLNKDKMILREHPSGNLLLGLGVSWRSLNGNSLRSAPRHPLVACACACVMWTYTYTCTLTWRFLRSRTAATSSWAASTDDDPRRRASPPPAWNSRNGVSWHWPDNERKKKLEHACIRHWLATCL